MVDCPARFIRQIGRGREQEIANSCRIIAELFYRGREEEQQEDPLRASAAAPPPLSRHTCLAFMPQQLCILLPDIHALI